jgi:hypothetical protein
MRRESQEIVPNLWLGPYSVARDKAALKEKGITHLICIMGIFSSISLSLSLSLSLFSLFSLSFPISPFSNYLLSTLLARN